MWWSFLTADGVTTARLDVGPLDVRCWRTTLFWGLEQIRLDRWLAEMSVYACVCVGWVSVCACRCVCVCVHEGGNKSVWMCMLVRNCEWVTAYMTACVHVGVYMCVGVCVCAIIYGVCVCVRERERDGWKYLHIFTKICEIEMWIQRSSYFDNYWNLKKSRSCSTLWSDPYHQQAANLCFLKLACLHRW